MLPFNSDRVLGLLMETLCLGYPQRKKSGGVKSGDRGGQETSLEREIN